MPINFFDDHEQEVQDTIFVEEAKIATTKSLKDPARFRNEVRTFYFLGLGYLIGIMILLGAAFLGAFFVLISMRASPYTLLRAGILLSIVLLPAIGWLARSIFFTAPPPNRPELKESDAPKLHAAIREISRAVGYRGHPKVLIGYDVEIAALERSRIGPFGPYDHFLILGLPLLDLTSPEEVQALIAQQLTLFAKGYSRLELRNFRMGWAWKLLSERLTTRRFTHSYLFEGFMGWYMPRFNAVSSVMYRLNQAEADAISGRVYGIETLANALVHFEYERIRLHRASEAFNAEGIKTLPAPPQDFLSQILSTLQNRESDVAQRRTIAGALAKTTDNIAIESSLADRLHALKAPVDVDEVQAKMLPLKVSAANELLGASREIALQRISDLVIPWFAAEWKVAFEKATKASNKLSILRTEPLTGVDEPTQDERARLLEIARLNYQAEGADKALPYLRELDEKFPNDPEINFRLASVLLETKHPEGPWRMNQCLAFSDAFEAEGLERLAYYYEATLDEPALQRIKARQTTLRRKTTLLDDDAVKFRPSDEYISHGLNPETVQILQDQLRARKDIERAYWVRKVLLDVPGAEQLVLILFNRRLGIHSVPSNTLAERFGKQAKVPVKTHIFAPENHKLWSEQLDKIPGALIFDSKQKS